MKARFRKQWFLVAWLLLLSGPLAAQHGHRYWAASPDSLRRVLATQRTDTARLRTLLHLIDCSFYTSESVTPDLAAAVTLTKRLRRPEHRALRLLLAGMQGKGVVALDSLQAAVTAFDQLHRPAPLPLSSLREAFSALNREDARLAYYQTKCAHYLRSGDTVSLAVCYHALGGSYTYRGDYNQATSQYLRATELARSVSPHLYYGYLQSAGGSYAKWGNYAKALHYLRLAAPGLTRATDRALLFRALGYVYLRQRNYPAALHAADQVLRATTVVPGPVPVSLLRTKAYAWVLKSQALLALGQVAEAGVLLQQAQPLADSLHLPLVATASPFELDASWARYYEAWRAPARAEPYWLAAYRKAREAHSTPLRLVYLRALARHYQERGQMAPAARYYQAATALADTLSDAQGALQVAQFEIEQADRAQQARISGLRQQQLRAAAQAQRQRRVLLYVSTGVGLLLLLAGVLYAAFRRSERLKRLVTAQKQDLQTQRDELDTSLTKLRATQAQLIHAEKMASLGELTAGIAHEIQNPLNFVNNFSEVSAELVAELKEAQAAGDEEEVTALADDLSQNLHKITQHGQRAAAIVRGMLEHSRASTGERAPTDLNALANEYLRLAYQGLRAKDKTFNTELKTDFAPALPLVEGVGADLGRVLLNLFNNAFYAVQQRQRANGELGYLPTVSLTTRHIGSMVELRVSDNGTGMPAEVQAKIFQPFFTTKPTGEGTGLGLSLAHDIIAQGHGGSLTVESYEGQGTTFYITLPLASASD